MEYMNSLIVVVEYFLLWFLLHREICLFFLKEKKIGIDLQGIADHLFTGRS
jgi:hypothetical protein